MDPLLKNNPLLWYPKPIAFRRVILFGIAHASVWLLISIWLVQYLYLDVLCALFQMAWIFTVLWIIVIGVSSVRQTLARLQMENVELVYLTPLTPRQWVVGYALRNLSKFPYVFVHLLGQLPILTLGMGVELLYLNARIASKLPPEIPIAPPTSNAIILPTLGFVISVVGTWFLPIWASITGVEMALWWRDELKAIGATCLALLMVLGLWFGIFVWVLIIPQSAQYTLAFCVPVGTLALVGVAFQQALRFADEIVFDNISN